MALPSTMKAWRFHTAAGGAENHMRLEDMPLPASFHDPPPGTTVVKVIAVSLNPVDIKFASIPYIGGFIQRTPATPGTEGVGRVARTTNPTLSEGQLVAFRVRELSQQGALAEYVLVSKEGCVPVPEGVTPVQAATVGTCGPTAYQALGPNVKHRDAEPFRVFLNAGSGGTGCFEIQIAKALGCHVTTSCSTRNVELCKSLGADVVVDYQKGPVEEQLVRMVRDGSPKSDLVVDNLDAQWKLYKASDEYLADGGRYIQIGGGAEWATVRNWLSINLCPRILGGGRRPWKFLAMKTSAGDAEKVLRWMAEGKIRIPIEEEFGFEDVPAAYRRLVAGRTRGKILVWVEG